MLANVLAQAIFNYVDEKGIASPQEISVTIETMPSLTWPEINVGPPEPKDEIISAKIKLPGKEIDKESHKNCYDMAKNSLF